jgi:MoxR-like ATPase
MTTSAPAVGDRSLQELLAEVRGGLQRVIIGQEAAIDLALVTLFSGAHSLIEGVPGVAKTLLVRALARLTAGEFQRIQFTPDLMPTDITGTNVFDLRTQEFRLVRGPIFSDFLLADEINRAPAKTQSALLQAMQEREVSIDRVSYALPRNFTVFATQNPIEYQGTYPLPEAQKDRFLLKIAMGYPSADEELALALRSGGAQQPETVLAESLQPALTAPELARARRQTADIHVSDEIARYAVALVRGTREHPAVMVGAGPRASLAFITASRTLAALRGRDFVTPDDVKELATPVLEIRLLLRPEFELEGVTPQEVIAALLEKIEVPR